VQVSLAQVAAMYTETFYSPFPGSLDFATAGHQVIMAKGVGWVQQWLRKHGRDGMAINRS
jgi:hypothetical protein